MKDTPVPDMSQAEEEVFGILLRQIERGRVVEWAGLSDITPEELCGWLLWIYASKENQPQLAQDMTEIGTQHLNSLKKMDNRWFEAVLKRFFLKADDLVSDQKKTSEGS